MLDLAAIWPFNASNAAVPLAAAILGHLPGDANLSFLPLSEGQFVNLLGYAIFLLAFVPLIFGGTVYKMLERIMAFKLVVVLLYLSVVAVFMISGPTAHEVLTGFFRFGVVPLRADTVVADRHFNLTERAGEVRYTLKGTMRAEGPEMVEFVVDRAGDSVAYERREAIPETDRALLDQMSNRAATLAEQGRFFVEDTDQGVVLTVRGRIRDDRSWMAETFSVNGGEERPFEELNTIGSVHADRARAFVANQGLERVGIIGYLRKNGRLPELDWTLIAVFVAIAGAGGMTNTMFSNYAREKGWGMGGQVGAIPSAVGGRAIVLSHVGKTFVASETNRLH